MCSHLFEYIAFLKLNQAFNMNNITCYFSEEEVKNIQLVFLHAACKNFVMCTGIVILYSYIAL